MDIHIFYSSGTVPVCIHVQKASPVVGNFSDLTFPFLPALLVSLTLDNISKLSRSSGAKLAQSWQKVKLLLPLDLTFYQMKMCTSLKTIQNDKICGFDLLRWRQTFSTLILMSIMRRQAEEEKMKNRKGKTSSEPSPANGRGVVRQVVKRLIILPNSNG